MHGSWDKERRTLAGPPRSLFTFWTRAIQSIVVWVVILALGVGVALGNEREAILAAVRAYTAALYARDYAEAYRWIAATDRRLKNQADYEQDNEPFKGTSLAFTRRLAQEIVIHQPVIERQGERAKVRGRLSLPNGNAEAISDVLFAEGGFSEAPLVELGERRAKIEVLIASGKLPTVEVEGEWTLVRDPEGWRVFLDWGSGVRMHFATHVPKGLDVTAAFDRAEVLTPRGEAVYLRLMVRNHSSEPVRLKVVHRVEPSTVQQQLDLVQCGYLFAREVAGGGVDEDLSEDMTQLQVTLEFVALE